MLPSYTQQPQMQNLVGMWGPMGGIWNLGPGIPVPDSEKTWALQNLNQYPDAWALQNLNQDPDFGLMNLIGATSNSNKLAAKAKSIAQSRNTVGKCYGAVADAVDSVSGRFLYGSSAYMAADQLKNSGKYTEH